MFLYRVFLSLYNLKRTESLLNTFSHPIQNRKNKELHISFDEEKHNEMLQEWSKIQNLTGKQQKEIAQEERNNLKAFVQKYEYSYTQVKQENDLYTKTFIFRG